MNKLNSTIIKTVRARKVLDARAGYTIEVDVLTEGGGIGRSTAPVGAAESRSAWEVQAYPFGGVDEAVEKAKNDIAPRLIGMDANEQEHIDQTLRKIDGTPNFARIGGNTATVTSIAVAKATASTLEIPLYKYLCGLSETELSIPIANTIGGGPHARRGKAPDMQEHQVIPVGAKSIASAVNAVAMAHQRTMDLCNIKDPDFWGRADYEHAWVPNITDVESLELLTQVCEDLKNETGINLCLGIDVAASSLWNETKEVYLYRREGLARDTGEQLDFISDLIEEFSLYFIEDPFHDDDYASFKELTMKYGDKCLICGDDIFACSYRRLMKGIEAGAANSVIIKVNMVGTLTDAFKTVELAHKHGYIPVQSRRSVENEDTAIAHIAVGWACPLNKFAVGGDGALKLNELLRIEEELGLQAKMPNLRLNP